MVKFIYGKVLSVLSKKPFRLWGISLLAALLISVAGAMGILPIIVYPIVILLQQGMAMVYLAGYRGGEYKPEDLFTGFKNFWHNVGGLAWRDLWVFLWGLIPVVGPIFVIIKTYSYRFVPYLLAENKDMPATDAKKVSEEKTEGIKGKMFAADLLLVAVFVGALLVLSLFGLIPYVGVLFKIIMVLGSIVYSVIAPLISGLVSAAFYDEIAGEGGSPEFKAFLAQKQAEKQLKDQMKQQMEMMKKQQAEQMKMQQLQMQQQMMQQQQLQQQQMMQQMQQNQVPPTENK